jgi:glycosyltransferase involved in cell wall biosynthesis
MQTTSPTVSVIVPAYNAQRTIRTCLQSLLELNYPRERYEIIVVENGSTDDTAAIVEEFPVRLYRSARRGPAPARNLGIAMSQAEIIAFTDSDCVAQPDWLCELVAAYADPIVGGTCGRIESYQAPEQSKVEQFCDECLPLVNYISGPAEFLPHLYTANASYRRALLVQLGGFNEGMFTGEDVDLSWRLQLETADTVRYVERAVIYHWHRATAAGLARQYRQYGFGEILLDTLYGGYPGYPRTRRFQLRRMLGQVQVLPRYVASALVRLIRLALGRETPYGVLRPLLWLLIESSNLRGKLEALAATRLMRRTDRLLASTKTVYLQRYY